MTKQVGIWLTERIVLSDTNCNHGSDLGTPVIWLKPSSQIGMVVYRNKSYHHRKSRLWFERERYLRLRELPKFSRKQKWQKIAKSGRKWCRTQTDCFRIVYVDKKKALARTRKCLIIYVDQTGLEPVTSRL